jgi:hypothetical protein
MTEILAEIIRNNFQVENPEHISVFGINKILNIDLSDEYCLKNISRKTKNLYELKNHSMIENLAGRIFDVNFRYESKENLGAVLTFEPQKSDSFDMNHRGHYIKVHLPSSFPKISIGTGDKGSGVLLSHQRANYFEFVKGVYDIFYSNHLRKEIFRKFK